MNSYIANCKRQKFKFTHVTKKKLTGEANFFQQINSNLDVNQGKYYLLSDFKQSKMDA